jgi:hypothetical protein
VRSNRRHLELGSLRPAALIAAKKGMMDYQYTGTATLIESTV